MAYFKQTSMEVNKVYITEDLTIFNQIVGNRPPNPQHIRRLADSIKFNGILQNPIIVNEDMEVIDGQHRLMAAKEAGTGVYYIVVKGYKLEQVQALNLNQKNWSKKDFMEGYARMGIKPYVKLKEFCEKNSEFNMTDCISLCQNSNTASSFTMAQKYRADGKKTNLKQIFEEGTWEGKDFDLAQEYADKLKMIAPYYDGYRRSTFVSAMLGLFKRDNFNFIEFMHKLKLRPNKLVDCANVDQYRLLIEEIYNHHRGSRGKVNLRF
jgi:hypothetical protein